MMPLMNIFNSPVGSIDGLVSTGVGVLLGTVEVKERVIVGSRLEGYKKVELTFELG